MIFLDGEHLNLRVPLKAFREPAKKISRPPVYDRLMHAVDAKTGSANIFSRRI